MGKQVSTTNYYTVLCADRHKEAGMLMYEALLLPVQLTAQVNRKYLRIRCRKRTPTVLQFQAYTKM